MQNNPIDARALGKAGIAALNNGDASGARQIFERMLSSGLGDASICLALAYACRNLKDRAAELEAVDRALALEPRNLRALIFKGDWLDEDGDARAASSYYLAATKLASETTQLPADLHGEVAHAKAMCDRYAGQFEKFLLERLSEHGLDDSDSKRRFRQSIDILAGRKQPYFQQPRYYFFPELPQIQFFARQDFPWLDRVEQHTAEIRAELMDILKDHAAFKPYVQANLNQPQSDASGMLNNPDWSAFYLWKNGEAVSENAARCPKTMAVIANIPFARANNRSPSILFSLLRPGARIPPHNGFVNTRLICHLPLIVPQGCYFRVGNEVRHWVEGSAWLFDDTIEHEAWNDSNEVRVILLFEVWRPELSEEERGLVRAMFEAIDAQSGKVPAWEI